MSDWQKVFEDTTIYRAEIVMAILDENNLSPVLINKKDSSYQFGHFEVHVQPDDVLKAIKIITEDIKFE